MAVTISGVLTAMATPFSEDRALDLDAARRLARHLMDNGSHGLVVAGTTGESPTLSDAEKLSLLEAVKDEVGDQATIVCGTGSNDTRHSVELTTAACSVGADAALVVTPYYNKPNRAGLRAHFEAVAEAAGDTPVILYNIPSRCVINLPPDFLAELAAEIPNIAAVKQANDADLGPIEGLDVLAGNDTVFLRCLELGGTGGILVSSHLVGAELRAMYEAAIAGDGARAHELDAELQPIYEATAVTSNPIPVKAALEMLGVIEGHLRLPMVPASQQERAAVRAALERHGLLVAGGTT
jgi:4-hydroxy-tetrahydrodipicolinate synthase